MDLIVEYFSTYFTTLLAKFVELLSSFGLEFDDLLSGVTDMFA